MKSEDKKLIEKIEEKVDWIVVKMEEMKSLDYIYFTDHPYKRIWHNFVNGIARGVGSAIGFSVIFTLILMVLRWIADINLPLISALVEFLLSLIR